MTTTILTTAEILSANRVTTEQVSKVTFRNRGAEVESQTTTGLIYYVRKNLDHNVLACSCPAGAEGRGCWHKRATVAKLQLLKVEERIAASYEQAAAIEADPEYQAEYREAFSCGCGGR